MIRTSATYYVKLFCDRCEEKIDGYMNFDICQDCMEEEEGIEPEVTYVPYEDAGFIFQQNTTIRNNEAPFIPAKIKFQE